MRRPGAKAPPAARNNALTKMMLDDFMKHLKE